MLLIQLFLDVRKVAPENKTVKKIVPATLIIYPPSLGNNQAIQQIADWSFFAIAISAPGSGSALSFGQRKAIFDLYQYAKMPELTY
ncbi:hypothetical protein [Duganella sp. BuS-21]|uniref:hypothetical protein n=1 Tax=Duganella sp. BuS-21 TaxID=2943848 RepID=UPI0035A59CA2